MGRAGFLFGVMRMSWNSEVGEVLKATEVSTLKQFMVHGTLWGFEAPYFFPRANEAK